VKFFHGVQVAVMFGLMTNIVQFAYWNCQKKRKSFKTHWGKYRPVYLLMLATVLVNAQPCCMMYIGSWKCDGQFSTDQIDIKPGAAPEGSYYEKNGSYMLKNGTAASELSASSEWSKNNKWFLFNKTTSWAPGCDPEQQNFFFDGGVTSALVPNTTVGWMIQIFGTYLGFGLMFVGVCQATLLHTKIAKKWRALRGRASVRASDV